MPAPGIVHNADGLNVQMSGDYQKFNSPYVNRLRGLPGEGATKWYIMDVDLELVPAGGVFYPNDLNNDGTRDGFSTGEAYLPAGSSIVRAFAVGTEIAAGGTSFTVGTYTVAGAAISATGIMTASEGVLANLGTVGEKITCAGALTAQTSGTVGITADSYVAVGATGTFTAGKFRLFIEVAN
jgi:hypothetical protein